MNDEKKVEDMNPKEWIALHRKHNGYVDTAYQDQEHWKELSGVAKKHNIDIGNVADKNDSWRDDKIIDVVTRMMVLSDDQREALESVNIYIFPTNTMRARVAKTPRGDTLILLHIGIIRTIFKLSQLIALMSDPRRYVAYMTTRGVMTALCVDIGQAFSDEIKKIKLDENLARVPLTESQYRAAATMAYGCLIFIIGHEIGHIVHEHDGYTDNVKLNHKAEFEADETACDIFYEYCKFSSMVLSGPQLENLFCVPYIAVGMINMVSSLTDKHPSPKTRLEKVLTRMRRKILNEMRHKRYETLDSKIELLHLRFKYKVLKKKGEVIYDILENMGEYMTKMHDKAPYMPIS